MIYVVTNRKLIQEGTIFDAVERAANTGVDAVILREKDLGYSSLLSLAEEIKVITDRHNIPLVINGNPRVANDINSFGVHISYPSLKSLTDIRTSNFGVSIHSIQEAIDAERYGAKYVIAGNIFETSCKPGLKGRGLGFIKELKSQISIPIIAIGGVGISNAKEVMEAGASGVAVMSSAMTDYDGSFIKSLKKEISAL